MIFNAHFLLMSMQAVWLPMMTAVVMLIIGHLAVGARKAIIEVNKFVEKVGQVTFAGPRAGREGHRVLYVTERCVFALRENGLELVEVAPGIDLDRDILSQLPFEPIINDIKEMDKALFHAEPVGLRDRLHDIGVEERLHYEPASNTIFMDYSGMRVSTTEEVDRIVAAVDNVLKPVGGRVNSIVNYDAFWVDPDVAEYYLDAVRYVESTYYLKVSRYTTNGFMRIKLSQGLEERDISSDVVQTFVEAKESLDSD